MKDWIPQTVVKMPYTTRRGSYSIAFYVRLDPSVVSPGTKSSEKPETIIAVKLLVSQDIMVLFSPIGAQGGSNLNGSRCDEWLKTNFLDI